MADFSAELVTMTAPVSTDVSYHPWVFTQCFLPVRSLPKDTQSWQTKHGQATLLIRAGVLLDPDTGDFRQLEVPAGPAARLALSHIHNHIVRAPSLERACVVPMGDSLRSFFKQYDESKWCGSNGKELTRQVHNLAAAHITIGGMVDGKRAKQVNIPTLAQEIDFWLEKDERQRTLWQPTMTVNPGYAKAVRDRCVPHDLRALLGLYRKARAMDIYVWLTYRLPQVKQRRGVFIPYKDLWSIFGAGIRSAKKFRETFSKDLRAALEYYPEGRVGLEPEGVRLFKSPKVIPSDHVPRGRKSQFFPERGGLASSAAPELRMPSKNISLRVSQEGIARAKEAAGGREDIYSLLAQWEAWWKQTGKPEVRKPDAAFLAFCRTHRKRQGR